MSVLPMARVHERSISSHMRVDSPRPSCRSTVAAWILLLALASPAAGADSPTPPDSVDAVLGRLRAAWKGSNAVEARFEQTSSGLAFPQPLTQKGTLQLEAPGRMRWDFLSPEAKSWISDGERMWIVDERDRTCTALLGGEPTFARLFDFVSGRADVRDDFTVTALPPTEQLGEGLRLVPKGPDAPLRLILVRFDPITSLLARIETESSFGDRTEIRFSEVRVLADLPDDRFQWVPREGYQLIDGG